MHTIKLPFANQQHSKSNILHIIHSFFIFVVVVVWNADLKQVGKRENIMIIFDDINGALEYQLNIHIFFSPHETMYISGYETVTKS